jgi:hypothetical protein
VPNPTERQNFVTKTWDDREAIGKNDSDYAKSLETHPWMEGAGEHIQKMVKHRINRNVCIDGLADRVTPENWDSLTPRMRTWMQDLLDVVRSMNNA